jgi:hypothetical protein
MAVHYLVGGGVCQGEEGVHVLKKEVWGGESLGDVMSIIFKTCWDFGEHEECQKITSFITKARCSI